MRSRATRSSSRATSKPEIVVTDDVIVVADPENVAEPLLCAPRIVDQEVRVVEPPRRDALSGEALRMARQPRLEQRVRARERLDFPVELERHACCRTPETKTVTVSDRAFDPLDLDVA